MEGKGRSRRRRGGREARRRISALLSVALTTAMTLNAPLGALGFGVMEAFASSSDARPATGSDAGSGTSAPDGGHAGPEDPGEGWMTARNAEYLRGQSQDVDIYVIAEDTDVAPGNTSTMRLYLKNNTGSPITDGTLSFTGTRIKKGDGTFTDISGSGVSAEDTTVDDWGDAADMDEDQLDELEALEAEEYAREFGKDGDGQGLNKLTGLHLEPGQLHEIEFEFYTDDSVSAGKAYVDFKFQGEGADGKVRSSEKFYYSIGLPSVEIELLDGQALETGVEHELSIWMAAPSWGDYEIEEVQIPVKGTTAAETEAEAKESTAPTEQGEAAGTQGTEAQTGEAGTEPETEATGAQTGATEAQTEEETQVAVIIEDEPVPIQAEDSGEELTAGIILNERETVQAPLKRTADVSILETEASSEGTTEEAPEAASKEEPVTTAPTEAPSPTTEPATPAGQETEGTQESAAPTETAEGTAAAADPTDPTAESITDPASAAESTAPTESTVDEDAIKASQEAAAKEAEQTAQQAQALAIKESKVSYTVEVFGTEFKRFRPKKTTEIEDIGWISCLYELAEDARPGVYYGKVTAKGKWNKRSFTTSQGFLFEITGEGTITLKGELDGTEVKVSGPASSFPEADKLELVVEALSQEEEEAVQEAIEKKDAPYATFSLSLLANGETADTTGPVTVKVGNRTIKESTAQLTAANEARAAVAAAAEEATAEPQAQAGTEDTYTADDTTDTTTDTIVDTTDSTTDAITDDAEGAKAPVDTRKGPGADGKGFSGAALTADGTLRAAAEAKAEKETQEPVIADSQEAGLALMRIDTLAVEAEEVKADVTESGDLQMATSEVMAIYAVTGLDEAHPVFIDSVTLEDGVTVTVAAAENVLPAGTTLSVEEVTAQVADIVKEDLETKGKTGVSEVLAYDINLMVDGKKLENEYWNQDDKVKVTFSGKKIEEISQKADTVEIAPLETPTDTVEGAKKGVAEIVKLEEITADNTHVLVDEIQTVQEAGDGAVSEFNIDAEHFTIYVVMGAYTSDAVSGFAYLYVAADDDYKGNDRATINKKNYKRADITVETNDPGKLGVDFKAAVSGEKATAQLWRSATEYPEYADVYYKDGSTESKVVKFKVTGDKRGGDEWDNSQGKWVYKYHLDNPKVTAILANGQEKEYTNETWKKFYWIAADPLPAGETRAYFYIMRPGNEGTDLNDESWRYVGKGSIDASDLPDRITGEQLVGVQKQYYAIKNPETADGKIKKYPDPNMIKEGVMELYKDEIGDNVSLEDLTVICTPFKISYPGGWVDENLSSLGGNVPTYHVDMVVSWSVSKKVKVNYLVKQPKATDFELTQEDFVILDENGEGQTSPAEGKYPLEKEGYSFVGWYLNPDFTGDPVNFDTYKVTGATNFYAKYVPAYTLTLKKTLDGMKTPNEAVQKVRFKLEKAVVNEQSGSDPEEEWITMRDNLTPNADGAVTILLPVGKYRLQEVETADGYQLLTGAIYFDIVEATQNKAIITKIANYEDNKGFWKLSETGESKGDLDVTNYPGAVLPDTGGPGLLQFNRFGWLLLLIALMMAGTEVRYFGAQKSRVEAEATEDRWPGSQGPDWM